MTSSWQLGPIVRGLRGHRAAAALVVGQLAIGLAITVLAALLGDYFVRRNEQPSSFAEADLTLVELHRARAASGATSGAAAWSDGVLAEVRALPGVTAATVRLPLDAIEHAPDELRTAGGAAPVAAYALDAGPGIAAAAGIALTAGRDLTGDDLRPTDATDATDATGATGATDATPAIVSASLARALWPGRDPLGATFASRARGRAIVVGVAGALRSPLIGRGDDTIVYATAPRSPRTLQLLVRSAPGRAAADRALLGERLRGAGRHATVVAVPELTRRMAAPIGAVVGILAAMVGAIVVVILTGSMGLTYFLVARRTREIGLRRAMGATRGDVVRDFVLENALYTVAGGALGLAIVAAVLPALASAQEDFVARGSIIAIAVAAVAGLNLVATLVPALRAAAVPPAVASRTT